jgi:DNA-binding transcriptional ArsR family regulator
VHLFAVLADDTRRRIVELLAEGERTAGELAAGFAVSQPAVSRHLRVLRESGLVRAEVRGQQRVYSLVADPLVEVDEWLDRYRVFWTQRLDALDTEIRRGRRAATTGGSRHRPDHTMTKDEVS